MSPNPVPLPFVHVALLSCAMNRTKNGPLHTSIHGLVAELATSLFTMCTPPASCAEVGKGVRPELTLVIVS